MYNSNVHTFVQLRGDPTTESDEYKREFHLRFGAQLYDLVHASSKFGIHVSSPNLDQAIKVGRALLSNSNLIQVSLVGHTSSNFDPSPPLDDMAKYILSSITANSNIRSLTLGYQLDAIACQMLERSAITELFLDSPNESTLMGVACLLPKLESLGIVGTGISHELGIVETILKKFVHKVAAAPLQRLCLDGFGMMGDANPLPIYYSILATTQSIEHLMLDFRIRHCEPELEVLMENIRLNSTLRSITVKGFHEEHGDKEVFAARLQQALNDSPSPHPKSVIIDV